MDPEIIEQLNEQFREMSEILSQQNNLMAAQIRNMQSMSGGVNNSTSAIRNNTNATNDNTQSTRELTEQQQKHAQTINKFDSIIKTTTDGLGGFAAALFNTTQGMTKYADAIGQFGNTVADWGRQSNNIFGYITGQLTKVSAMALQEELKRTENVLKFNDTLSKMGAANRFTTNEIAEMGKTVGLSRANLDRMLEPMKKLGSTFQAMGFGTADAMQKYTQMLKVSEEERREFQRLGYVTDEERFEAQGRFLEATIASGMSIRTLAKDTDALRKMTLDYTRELTVLADITGKSVEEVEKQRREAAATAQFQVWARQQTIKAIELEKSGRTDEAKAIRANVKLANDIVYLVDQVKGKEYAAAMAEMFATGGTTTIRDVLAQASLDNTLGSMEEVARKVNQGQATIDDGIKLQTKFLDATNNMVKEFGPVLAMSQDLRSLTGTNDITLMRNQSLLLDQTVQERLEAYEKAKKAVSDNEEGKGPTAEDPNVKLRSDLIEFERYAQQQVDGILKAIGPLKMAFAGLTFAALTAGFALARGGILSSVGATTWATGAASAPGASGLPKTPKIITDGGNRYVKSPGGILIPQSMAQPTLPFSPAPSTGSKIMSSLSKAGKVLGRLGTPLMVLGGAYSAYSGYTKAQELESQGKINEDEAAKMKGKSVGSGAGGIGGGLAGAKLGALAGAAAGPLGVAIGGILGGALGYFAGEKLGGIIGESISGASDKVTKDPEKKQTQQKLPENVDTSFNSAVISFGRIVSSFGKIVGAYGKSTKAIISAVNALEKLGVYNKIKSANEEKELLGSFSNNKDGSLIDYISNLKVEFEQATKATANMMDDEIKRHNFNEMSMLKFRLSIEDLTEKFKILALITPKQGGMPGSPEVDYPGGIFGYDVPQDVTGNLRYIAEALRKKGFGDENYINAVLGNIMKESGGRMDRVEDISGYANTSNARIRNIFEKARGMSDAELNALKSNPQAFANVMYATKGGNREPGDGWKFRGRGPIQLTGRENYEKASKDIFGDDRLVRDPDLVLRPDIGAEVVAWYMYKTEKSMRRSFGFDRNQMLSKQEAALLATSQIAGQKIIRGSGYLGTENLQKVERYAALMPSLLRGKPGGRSGSLANLSNVSLKELGRKGIIKLGGGITGNIENLENINPDFERRLVSAILEYHQKTNKSVTLTSGFRYPGDQAKINSGSNPKAAPGNSRHERGLAIDFSSSDVSTMNSLGLLEKFGLIGGKAKSIKGGYLNDPPHIEIKAAQGGIFDGPSSGYPAELHGSEMVAPLDTNSILMKLATTPASTDLSNITTVTSTIEKETIEKISNTNLETMQALLDKFDSLINAIEEGNSVRDKMYKTSMI